MRVKKLRGVYVYLGTARYRQFMWSNVECPLKVGKQVRVVWLVFLAFSVLSFSHRLLNQLRNWKAGRVGYQNNSGFGARYGRVTYIYIEMGMKSERRRSVGPLRGYSPGRAPPFPFLSILAYQTFFNRKKKNPAKRCIHPIHLFKKQKATGKASSFTTNHQNKKKGSRSPHQHPLPFLPDFFRLQL